MDVDYRIQIDLASCKLASADYVTSLCARLEHIQSHEPDPSDANPVAIGFLLQGGLSLSAGREECPDLEMIEREAGKDARDIVKGRASFEAKMEGGKANSFKSPAEAKHSAGNSR